MPRKGWKASADLGLVDIDAIEVPSWARRINREYMEESVQERGIIKPLIVAAIPNGHGRRNRYILLDGVGRIELARKRGDKQVPARIIKCESEEEALLLAIELEHTRAPWSLEYTLGIIQELLKRGYSKKQIAEKLRIPRSKLYRLLYILELPQELQEMFLSGKLPLRASEMIKSVLDAIEASSMKEEYKQGLRERFINAITEFPDGYENYCQFYREQVADWEKISATVESTDRIIRGEEEEEEEAEEVEERPRIPRAVPLTPLEEEEKPTEEAEEERPEERPEEEEVEEVEVIEEVEEAEERPEEAETGAQTITEDEWVQMKRTIRHYHALFHARLLKARTPEEFLQILREEAKWAQEWAQKVAAVRVE